MLKNNIQLFNSLTEIHYIVNSVNCKAHQLNNNLLYSAKDFSRNRILTLKKMILSSISEAGGSWEDTLILNHINTSVPAYIKQLKKMKTEIFNQVLQMLNKKFYEKMSKDPDYLITLNGKFILAVDGSDFKIPCDPHNDRYKLNNNTTYYQMHVNFVYDVLNKIYNVVYIQPKNSMDERIALEHMLDQIPMPTDKYIIIGDRGYMGLNLIETFNENNVSYLVRASKQNNSTIKHLPNEPLDVETYSIVTNDKNQCTRMQKIDHHWSCVPLYSDPGPQAKYAKDKSWTHKPTVCHRVPYRVVIQPTNNPNAKQKYEILITNMSATQFTATELVLLYHLRWRIEVSFKHLKYDHGGLQFRSFNSKFNEIKIFATAIFYNLTSINERDLFMKNLEKEIEEYQKRKNNKHKTKPNHKIVAICFYEIYRHRFFRFKTQKEMTNFYEAWINRSECIIRPGRSDKRKFKRYGHVKTLLNYAVRV